MLRKKEKKSVAIVQYLWLAKLHELRYVKISSNRFEDLAKFFIWLKWAQASIFLKDFVSQQYLSSMRDRVVAKVLLKINLKKRKKKKKLILDVRS